MQTIMHNFPQFIMILNKISGNITPKSVLNCTF